MLLNKEKNSMRVSESARRLYFQKDWLEQVLLGRQCLSKDLKETYCATDMTDILREEQENQPCVEEEVQKRENQYTISEG